MNKLVNALTEAIGQPGDVPIQRQVKASRQVETLATVLETFVNDNLGEFDFFDMTSEASENALIDQGVSTGDEDKDMDLENDVRTTIEISAKVDRVKLAELLTKYGATLQGRVKRSIDYRGDDDDYDEAGNDLTQQATSHPAE